MATKVIREESSTGIVAVFAIVLLLVIGFVLYNQGYFGNDKADININLPNGQSISGSVSK
mgnify:CR=1 FL=1